MTGRLIAAAGLVLLLAGCGQKGPLHHPEPEPPMSTDSGNTQNDGSRDQPSR
ncbi:LPS translocon maturation chaperone LptM [Marinobacter fonticola]|uniref:LPS translocon maturation chaperone LptM n=1 Tax=Marinobacter fonticola TaxID=2603215 RepID=UPI0011E672EB|nr:lipoprotein [Marinobacter fonticola]